MFDHKVMKNIINYFVSLSSRSGISITFVTRQDWRNAKNLVDIMAEADQVS